MARIGARFRPGPAQRPPGQPRVGGLLKIRPKSPSRVGASPLKMRPQRPTPGWAPAPNSPAARQAPPTSRVPDAPSTGFQFDAQYEDESSAANKRYGDRTLDINSRRLAVKNDYGFDDVSNPFNRASMLTQSYQRGQAGRTNSGAAAGQLYAGSTQNSLNAGTETYNQNLHGLRARYAGALADLEREQAEAGYERDESQTRSRADSIGRYEPSPGGGGEPEPAPAAPGRGRRSPAGRTIAAANRAAAQRAAQRAARAAAQRAAPQRRRRGR